MYFVNQYFIASVRVCAVSLAVAAGCAAASALDVECSAGALESLVAEPASVTSLTVSGTVDASDLFFIDSSMPALRSLNLSGANIVAYSGPRLRNRTTYPAATIPANAFAGSTVTSLRLPQSETAVGDAAFAGSAIVELTLTPAVNITGTGAFGGCTALTSVTTGGATLGIFAFTGCPALTSVDLSGNATVPEGTFAGCTALAQVVGAEAVTTIGARAFDGCTALATFDFGTGLTQVGTRAFASSGLTSANLGDCRNLTTLGDWAFADCRSLATAILPAGLRQVGQGVFFDCTALNTVEFPVATLAQYMFKGAPLGNTSDIIADGTTEIGDYALKGATGISVLSIPNSVESIGHGAMEGMTGLTILDGQYLDHVPALGTDVWSGVDQSAVTLQLQQEVAPEFVMTPQWKDFHIEALSTTVLPVIGTEPSNIQGRFSGMNLELRAAEALGEIKLYDTAGTLLTSVRTHSNQCSIDTSAFGADIFIVTVGTADGSALAVLKLLR